MLATSGLTLRFIYALIDPRDYIVRYVGQTINPGGSRVRNHVCDAKRGDSSNKSVWIRELLDCGQYPIVDVLETGIWNQDSTDDREEYWIANFRNMYGSLLTNLKARGSGVNGSLYSEARKLKHSEIMREVCARPEVKDQRRKAMVQRYANDPSLKNHLVASMREWMSRPENLASHREYLKNLYNAEPERRAIIAEQSRERWSDPTYIARKTLQSEEYRTKRSEIAKRLAKTPEQQKVFSDNGRKSMKILRMCNDCSYTGAPPHMGIHLKATGHSGYVQLPKDDDTC